MEINYKNHIKDFGFRELYIGRVYAEWIFSIIKPFLGKVILEVGSGIGAMFEHFPLSSTLIQSDINRTYLKVIEQRFRKQREFETILLDIVNINKEKLMSLKSFKIDTVVGINVLEHIENDLLALKNINQIFKKNGRVILFVPAIPQIYGTLDTAFGHFRRYTKTDLIDKLNKAGFSLEYITYFNIFGILWWYITGKICKRYSLPNTTGVLLKVIVPILYFIETNIPISIGQSLIIVGRKK